MLRSLIIQVIVFSLIFQLLSWFKEADMLTSDDDLNQYQFTLPTTTGSAISLTPSKKTIIYFFAPWCGICHSSIENLQNIYQKNGNIEVIAIGLDYMEEKEIKAFVAEHQLTFPVAFGSEKVKQAYKVHAYPSYYVISEENTVLAKSLGYSTEIGLLLRTL